MKDAIKFLKKRLADNIICAEAWESLADQCGDMGRGDNVARYRGWAIQKRDIVAELDDIIEEMEAASRTAKVPTQKHGTRHLTCGNIATLRENKVYMNGYHGMTPIQEETYRCVVKNGGNACAAAREMGKDVSTVRQAYRAALRKKGVTNVH